MARDGGLCLGLTCHTQLGPCLTLPQSAFLWNGPRWATLETEGPGGRLEPGFTEVATHKRPPALRALAVAPSSSPRHLGSWEPEPALPPAGMEEGRAGPGRGHQASEGGLPYLQVLPPHVHRRERQLHLLPPGILVPFVGDLNEDQEDPGHDAPSHQHEDPWGRHPVPQLWLLRLRSPGAPIQG